MSLPPEESPRALQELWRLDIAPGPELCAAYAGALRQEASKITRARSDHLSVAMDLERQLPNLDWLTGAGCDLNDSLASAETNVRAVSDSSRMDQFAATLAALREAR